MNYVVMDILRAMPFVPLWAKHDMLILKMATITDVSATYSSVFLTLNPGPSVSIPVPEKRVPPPTL